MPIFGSRSIRNLQQVRPELRLVAEAAILRIDFTVICGTRGRAEQERAKRAGNSRAGFGQSPHNYKPSFAFDFIPSPFDGWEDPATIPQMIKIAGIMKEEAQRLAIGIEYGGDWKSFKDYPHVQLKNWRKYHKLLAE
jgi:peptidoglycan L-alanyl-D-glutamate endopeptidase CwlK